MSDINLRQADYFTVLNRKELYLKWVLKIQMPQTALRALLNTEV